MDLKRTPFRLSKNHQKRCSYGRDQVPETAPLCRLNACVEDDAPQNAAECWARASEKGPPRQCNAKVCVAASVRRGTPASVVACFLRYSFSLGCERAVLFFEDPHAAESRGAVKEARRWRDARSAGPNGLACACAAQLCDARWWAAEKRFGRGNAFVDETGAPYAMGSDPERWDLAVGDRAARHAADQGCGWLLRLQTVHELLHAPRERDADVRAIVTAAPADVDGVELMRFEAVARDAVPSTPFRETLCKTHPRFLVGEGLDEATTPVASAMKRNATTLQHADDAALVLGVSSSRFFARVDGADGPPLPKRGLGFERGDGGRFKTATLDHALAPKQGGTQHGAFTLWAGGAFPNARPVERIFSRGRGTRAGARRRGPRELRPQRVEASLRGRVQRRALAAAARRRRGTGVAFAARTYRR